MSALPEEERQQHDVPGSLTWLSKLADSRTFGLEDQSRRECVRDGYKLAIEELQTIVAELEREGAEK